MKNWMKAVAMVGVVLCGIWAYLLTVGVVIQHGGGALATGAAMFWPFVVAAVCLRKSYLDSKDRT